MLWNKRLVWPNQDWHHWQQLRAACPVCPRVCACLRVFTSACVCVCVCVCLCLSRWGDLIAQLSSERGKTRASCCQSSTNIKTQETDHNAPWLPAPPLPPPSLRVLCHASPPSHTHTHAHTGTPDHARADLEMKNDPPLAEHCCISSQLQSGGSGQILF